MRENRHLTVLQAGCRGFESLTDIIKNLCGILIGPWPRLLPVASLVRVLDYSSTEIPIPVLTLLGLGDNRGDSFSTCLSRDRLRVGYNAASPPRRRRLDALVRGQRAGNRGRLGGVVGAVVNGHFLKEHVGNDVGDEVGVSKRREARQRRA